MHTPDETASFGSMIAAVVVTYHPDAGVLNNIRRLAEQAGEVVVVDNGSTGPSAEVVTAAANLNGVQVIRNASNLGIASAMNSGIRRALDAGYSWIATFDQDSTAPDHYFEDLLRACDGCPVSAEVGMIVPGQWTTMTARVPRESGSFHFITAAPNSGCLIRAGIFAEVGYYDEAMFIDYVDVDFCLRVGKDGYRILSATNVVLKHELGTQETSNVLGRRVSFRTHSAWRYYYIMRNRVVMYGRHGFSFPRWMLRDAFWLPLELGRMVCLERGRALKLRCAAQGLWDGLCGRQGRHPDFPK